MRQGRKNVAGFDSSVRNDDDGRQTLGFNSERKLIEPERSVVFNGRIMQGSPRPNREFGSIRLLTLFAIFSLSACSTIVGTVKPVDEKSDLYTALNLEKAAPKVWRKLDQAQLVPKDSDLGSNSEAFSSEVTDVAYQSKVNSAIISLNSSCREGRNQVVDLRAVLRELLLGMSDVEERTETSTEVSGIPALSGTVAGRMAGERTKIRALVVSKDTCVYDLMYIARPDRFSTHEPDFNRFVSSVKLR
jgi:hypothetical protein